MKTIHMHNGEKITLIKGDFTTIITPSSEKTEKLAMAIYDMKQSVLPSNRNLEEIGDKINRLLEKSKTQIEDAKTIELIEKTEKIIQDIKIALNEKNEDEKLQEIVR